jgi:hypothetical protein
MDTVIMHLLAYLRKESEMADDEIVIIELPPLPWPDPK